MKEEKLKKKKEKIWSSSKADKIFSKYIRERDKKCVRCNKTESLQCSHFWSRKNSAVRYLPENCDTLCYACHYGNSLSWEYCKQGSYMYFKKTQLGEEGYKKLEILANSIVSRKDAIIDCMNLILQYKK